MQRLRLPVIALIARNSAEQAEHQRDIGCLPQVVIGSQALL
jgi:hypothetical protein